jgi:small-conductance mechanosensitive channel
VDTLLAEVTQYLEHWIAIPLGSRAGNTVAGSVTLTDLATVACFLLLALVSNALGALYLRRRAGQQGQQANLQRRVIAALRRPLYLLIWIYGVYVAATPVLLKLKPNQGLAGIRSFMDIAFDLGALTALFHFLFRATHVLEARMVAWASATPSKVDDLLPPLVGSSLRLIVIVVGIILGIPLLRLPAAYADVLGKLTSILLIASVTTLSFRLVNIGARVVLTRFDITEADNLRARKVYTQLQVMSRVLYVMIGFIAVAAVLMLFQEVRHVGASLLASAGIVGIIAGFAAQKTLANLFAGFQIALAQPVRQDDVVVVEGQWGRVEEITLSYVVVHIWDDRRLVLPLTYFIEKPFENWTRTSSALMGSVIVWVDYTFPVEEGRKALKDIVEASALWDRRFWNLQVSDASESTLQLRVLATSSDSSRSWDLRCEIREKFVAYIQAHHPSALPRIRASVVNDAPRQGID